MSNENDSEYEIKQTIGKGNFGKVLLGISKNTGKKVAIKIIDKLKMSKSSNSEQVKREINVINKMNHLNIVKIFKIENDFKKYKIIMEYCEKGELYDYIVEKRKLKEEEAAYFYFQLINGLEYIHSKNIVHRDLKPENLLITNNNILKIIDFGLCNYYDINKLLSTPCGSPSYASPEMVSGNKYDGILIDIWCTGIILFAMLFGYLPFEAEDNYSLFKKIIKCEINYPKNISKTALDLMEKILVAEPEKRINISQIKKHPFYLEGKKIFEETHSEYLIELENSKIRRISSKFNSNGQYTDKKLEGKKNIFFIRKNIKKNSTDEIDKVKLFYNNLDYRNSVGGSMKQNILYFNESLENNGKKKFNKNKKKYIKEKIFKKKNILNLNEKEIDKNIKNKYKICLTENNDENETINYIKPLVSPNNKGRKFFFNDKFYYNSSKNSSTKYDNEKFYNYKKLYNRNYSPIIKSIGPYMRPKLIERTISLKKENYESRNTVSEKRTLKVNNITINNSPKASERNSLLINNIKKYNKKKKYKILDSSFVYQHKSFNASALKDDKIIKGKKYNIYKNSNERSYEGNNDLNSNLNIYYTLNSSQTTKNKNIPKNIIFFPNSQQKLNQNKEKNLYNNIKNINPKKYYNCIFNINRRNILDKINPRYYGKTIDIEGNNNNYINNKINQTNLNDNYEEFIIKNEEIPNKTNIQKNKKINKLLNYHKTIFIKKKIKNENTSIKNSKIIKNITKPKIYIKEQNKQNEISNLAKGKKKINALIFNNQINQLNIYKNDNNINSYNLNSIYFYSNPFKTEQNELDLKEILNPINHLNTIVINKRCETENNDLQSNKNIMKKNIYKISKNKNQTKELQLNYEKIKGKKVLGNSLFSSEENKKSQYEKNEVQSIKITNNDNKLNFKSKEKDMFYFKKLDINEKNKKNY